MPKAKTTKTKLGSSAKSEGPSSKKPKLDKTGKKGNKSRVGNVAKKRSKPKSTGHVIKKFQPGDEYTKSSAFSLASYLVDPTWHSALKDIFTLNYVMQLEDLLGKDYENGLEIFPPKDKIFRAFELTPIKEIKVVIVGQDPYHDDGQAHGLAFSVPQGVDVPPSLKNIYKELATDIDGFKVPKHGYLEKWAQNGVFLLNAFLTVEAHLPGSHAKYGWKQFTDKVIQKINEDCAGVVFMLWGLFAHTKEDLIDGKKHGIIKTFHPSPLSFSKFSGCKCFSKANDLLSSFGRKPVDWIL